MRLLKPHRVLIVADQTAESRELFEAVTRRAGAGPCLFTLLVPAQAHGLHRVMDPEDHGVIEAHDRLDAALPFICTAADGPVVGMVGSHDTFAAVQDALNLLGFDEVIISMLPRRVSRWLHLDLPPRVRALGVSVTEVISTERPVGNTAA
jgi:hypothetical protein